MRSRTRPAVPAAAPGNQLPNQPENHGRFAAGQTGQPAIGIGCRQGLKRADLDKDAFFPSRRPCMDLNFWAYSTGDTQVSRKSAPNPIKRSARSI